MTSLSLLPGKGTLGSFAIIAAVIVVAAGGFAYTAGWLSPDRITPPKLVAALAPPGGPALGRRRNHVIGICFTGTFEANNNGTELSRAQAFASGKYPALGRFNLGTADLNAADATVRVRGMGLQITTPNGEEWRMAMIDLPFFPVSNPEAFYGLLEASGSKAPDAMKVFAAAHPEVAAFGSWAASAPWTASYAEERFNSLDAFIFTNAAGTEHAVRWSLLPQAQVDPITQSDLAKLGTHHLAQEITERVGKAPQRWTMVLTVADPGDPTVDPSKAWPADRRTVTVGTLVVQRIEEERDGPCRDINFDPTILPSGMRISDDPFPAARSAAYARSYNLRTAEVRDYPYHVTTDTGAKP
jgi:catalase